MHKGQFKPGQSGNPNGRPKRKSFREKIDQDHPELYELWLKQVKKKLEKGDSRVIVWFGDQYNGKAPQPVTGPDGGPIKVNIVQDVPVDD